MSASEDTLLGIGFIVRQNDVPDAMRANATAARQMQDAFKAVTSGQAEFTALGREQYQAAAEASKQTQDYAHAFQQLPAHIETTNEAIRRHRSEARLLRYELVESMAGLMLLTEAFGSQLPPALQDSAKGLRMVVEGAMAGNFILPGVGFAIGALAGLALDLATQGGKASDSMDALNKELDNMAKQTGAIDAIKQLAGVTDEEAKKAMEALKAHPELAKAIKEVMDSGHAATPVISGLGDVLGKAATAGGQLMTILGISVTALSTYVGALAQGKSEQQALAEMLQRSHEAVVGFKDGTQELASSLIQEAIATKEADDALKKYTDEVTRGKDIIERAQTELATTSARAWRSYTEEINRAGREFTDQSNRLTFEGKIADERNALESSRTQRTLREELARDLLKLTDASADAQLKYHDKIVDLEWDASHRNEELVEARVDRELRADRIIFEAKRNTIQKINDIDFKEGIDLADSKTERDAERIDFMADHERSVAERELDNKVSDTQAGLTAEERAATRKKALDDEVFAHRRDIAGRELGEELSKFERTYSEETARSRQANEDAVNDYKARIGIENEVRQHQQDDLKLKNKELKDDIRTRYDDATADANRHAAAVVANEVMLQLQYIKDWGARMAMLGAERSAREALSAVPFAGPGSPGGGGGGSSGFGQFGLDTVVSRPSVFMAGEGNQPERVKITPIGKEGFSGPNVSMNVSITSNDPVEVWNYVRAQLELFSQS